MAATSTNKWLMVIAGIIAILFGLLCFALPGATILTILVFFAIFAIIEAIILLYGGVVAGSGPGSARWVMIAAAVVLLILGILALWNPAGFVLTITFLIGIWIFLMGLFQIFAGIAGRSMPYWWLTLIVGIIGVLAGLYIMMQPVAGAIVILWVLGIYAIVFGIERIVMAFYPAPATAGPVAI